MAEAVLSRRSVVKNEYQLLADITVSSATTQVDITGLNIGKDEEIVLVSDINNTSGSGIIAFLYANANYTNTNYYAQNIYANGTSVTGGRDNAPIYMAISASSKGFSITKIKLTNNGYIVSQSSEVRDYGVSTMYMIEEYLTSTFTATSIISLRISVSTTNAIGIGSRFQLYKVAK